METTTAEEIQLPTQASADAAPDVFVPVADTPTDPFIAHPAVTTAETPLPAAPAPASADGWGADLLLAGVLLLAVLLTLAVVRMLRLKEALQTAQADERAAIGEARELRRRLAEAAARRPAHAVSETAEHAAQLESLVRERDELLRTNRLLQGMVRGDTVTGLANGPFLARQLAKELRRAMRTRKVLSLLVCDIDSFSAYNRVHGHEGGDALLKRIGALLGSRFQRGGDLVARLDADRFAVVMPETPRCDAERLAAGLEEAVREAAIAHGGSPHGPTVAVTVGVACATSHKLLHPHQLLAAATDALVTSRREAGRALPAAAGAATAAAAGDRETTARGTKPRSGQAKTARAPGKAAAAKARRGARKPADAGTPASPDEPGVTGTLFPEQAASQS
jgi:diguanylate cyclase (GGDEF)-like protein